MENKIKETERERKAMAGVTKLARERAKKANLHNRKLRDCRVHFSDVKNEQKEESSIFITEAILPAEALRKAEMWTRKPYFRCVENHSTAMVWPRKWCTKRRIQPPASSSWHWRRLRYIALQQGYRSHRCRCGRHAHTFAHHNILPSILPRLIKKGHVYVLQTPLFRVRNKRTKIKNKQIIEEQDAKRLKGEKKKRPYHDLLLHRRGKNKCDWGTRTRPRDNSI